jgi:hypothetical protein
MQKLTAILLNMAVMSGFGFLFMESVDAHDTYPYLMGPEFRDWPSDEHPVQHTPQTGPGVYQPRCMVQGTTGNDVLSVSGNDCVQGLRGNDNITVTDDKPKHIFPDKGNDIVIGGEGYDYIHDGNPGDPGPPDNDKIDGKGGDDKLLAGFGNDILTGGSGADIFECGPGQDRITDFNETEDFIRDKANCEQI